MTVSQPLPLSARDAATAPQCDRASFAAIADIMRRETGINLPKDNSALVVSRLIKLLRQLNLSTFQDYLAWIEDPDHNVDRSAMISALTTNTTQFYRESYHFDYLVQNLLPALRQAAERGERIRLWSAGCSSGEEAYSLAAALLHSWPEARGADLRILATDISATALRTAALATYPREQFDTMPGPVRSVMLREGEQKAGMVTLPKEVRDLVSVKYLNFIDPWPIRGPYHTIMCRNVAIYMDPDVQARIFSGLIDLLVPQGVLFIGHSERLPPQLADRMTLVGRTTFRRNAPTTQ